MDGDNKTTKKN